MWLDKLKWQPTVCFLNCLKSIAAFEFQNNPFFCNRCLLNSNTWFISQKYYRISPIRKQCTSEYRYIQYFLEFAVKTFVESPHCHVESRRYKSINGVVSCGRFYSVCWPLYCSSRYRQLLHSLASRSPVPAAVHLSNPPSTLSLRHRPVAVPKA